MNTAIDRPKIHLIQDEILRLLEIHNMPMTARYLDALCERHEDIAQIHKAIGNLSRLGLIEVAGTTDGRRGSIARLYRLAPKIEADEPSEAERLIDHLERDLAPAEEAIASADLASGPIGSRLMPATSASGSHAGDEFRSGPIADLSYDPDSVRRHVPPGPIAAAWPDAIERPPTRRQHFVARLIEQQDDPEPRVLGAALWADLFGAIADRLASGRALHPHPEVIAALRAAEQGCLDVAA